MDFNYPQLDHSKKEIRLLYPIPPESQEVNLLLERTWHEDDDIVVRPDLSLNFELRSVSLEDRVEYTALSYVWGPPTPVKQIVINGKPFQVRANLECALRHFQYKDIAPAIWIDAVCINQEDGNEKNHQIPLMARIYSGARDVLIWLGPGREETLEFAQVIREMHSIVRTRLEMNRKQLWFYMDDIGLRAELLQAAFDAVNAMHPSRSPLLRSALDFTEYAVSFVVTRDWWYRIWVIQECAVASNAHFHLGVHKFDCEWLWIWTRAHNFTHMAMLNSEARLNVDIIESMVYCGTIRDLQIAHYQRHMGPLSFRTVLSVVYSRPHLNRSSATDDRDRIYGLRGLAEEDFARLGLTVDYNQEYEKLFIQVAKSFIEAGDLDVLSHCYLKDEEDDSTSSNKPVVPSWTPDWTRPTYGPTSWFQKAGNSPYSASGNSSVVSFFTNYNAISGLGSQISVTLRGCVVDTVYLLTPPEFRSSDVQEYTFVMGIQRKIIESFVAASRDLGCNIYTPSQLREAVWRIPIRDREGFPECDSRPATAYAESLYKAALPLYKHAEASTMVLWWRYYPYPLDTLIQKTWRWVHLGYYKALLAIRRIQFENYAMGLWQTMLHPRELLQAIWDPENEPQTLFHAKVERTPITKQYTLLGKSRPSRPFLTSRGHIGLGPCSVERGDIVCLLYGARVPHILRKRGDGLPGYVLVGDAFVYGGMDGELMTGQYQDVDFEIF